MNVENALVAIAALGGVVWTGGLIVRQLYPSYLTIVLQSGMEAVMFAALAAVAGLFLSGLVLQGTAFAFFLLYEYGYVRDLMVLYNINAGITPVPANIPDVPRYLNDMYTYTRLEGFLLLPLRYRRVLANAVRNSVERLRTVISRLPDDAEPSKQCETRYNGDAIWPCAGARIEPSVRNASGDIGSLKAELVSLRWPDDAERSIAPSRDTSPPRPTYMF